MLDQRKPIRLFGVYYPSFWKMARYAPIHLTRSLYWRFRHHLSEKNAALGGCERCGSFYALHWHRSMTAYSWDGKGEDPNRAHWYCDLCGLDYDDYWEAMWAETSRGY